MRKRFSKLLSCGLALTVVLSAAAVTGCRKEEGINENMTQLYVQNFDGGFGHAWLDTAIERFEEKYKDEEFEPGKKGVEILVDNTRSMDNPSVSVYEVFFVDDTNYLNAIAAGQYLDITDMVRETVPGETRTIEDKLYDDQKKFLTSIDGKYYALPHYERTTSLIYDIDLFEDNNLYFAADRSKSNFILTKDQTRSAGPDGVSGTYDDGLPATIMDYKLLFDHMLDKGITPLVWTGAYVDYINKLLNNISANLAGKTEYDVRFSLDGNVEIITDYDTLESEVVKITKKNGYLLPQAKTEYQALKWLDIVFSNPDYYAKASTDITVDHEGAQWEFIYSKLENNPIAMLVDSNYWLNEADEAIRSSIEDYPETAQNRRFGYMPLPMYFDGEVPANHDKKQVMVHLLDAYGFINANIADNENKVRLAKLFLQYCYSDEILLEFTEATNTIKPLKYEYEAALDSFNSYAKTIYDVRKDADQVFKYTTDPMFLENVEVVPDLKSVIEETTYTQPVDAYKEGYRALDYFKGMQMNQADWEEKFKEYWE